MILGCSKTFSVALASSRCFSSPSNTTDKLAFFIHVAANGIELTERELLQSLAECLWKEEVDEDNFEAKPADIYNQVLPIRVLETNRVDKASCSNVSSTLSSDEEEYEPNITAVLPNS